MDATIEVGFVPTSFYVVAADTAPHTVHASVLRWLYCPRTQIVGGVFGLSEVCNMTWTEYANPV